MKNVFLGTEYVLGLNFFLQQEREKFSGDFFIAALGADFSNCERNGFWPQIVNRLHLLISLVDVNSFGGYLDYQLFAYLTPNRVNCIAIQLRTQRMRLIGVSHMQMDHAGTRICTGGCGHRQFLEANRQSRMVELGFPGTIWSDRDHHRLVVRQGWIPSHWLKL